MDDTAPAPQPDPLDALAELLDGADDDERAAAVAAVEATLAQHRYARTVGDQKHRVAHDLIVQRGKAEHHEPDGKGGIKVSLVDDVTRHNQIDFCPDCGSTLIGPRDADGPGVPILICSRLHGVSVALVPGLMAHDIVACGRPAMLSKVMVPGA